MFILLLRLCSSLILKHLYVCFVVAKSWLFFLDKWPSFGLFSFFFFWTNDQVLVSLNAYVHILFNHDISNLLPFFFCKKNLAHVAIFFFISWPKYRHCMSWLVNNTTRFRLFQKQKKQKIQNAWLIRVVVLRVITLQPFSVDGIHQSRAICGG